MKSRIWFLTGWFSSMDRIYSRGDNDIQFSSPSHNEVIDTDSVGICRCGEILV